MKASIGPRKSWTRFLFLWSSKYEILNNPNPCHRTTKPVQKTTEDLMQRSVTSSMSWAWHSGFYTNQMARSSLLCKNPRFLNHASTQGRLGEYRGFFSESFLSHSSSAAEESSAQEKLQKTRVRVFLGLEFGEKNKGLQQRILAKTMWHQH